VFFDAIDFDDDTASESTLEEEIEEDEYEDSVELIEESIIENNGTSTEIIMFGNSTLSRKNVYVDSNNIEFGSTLRLDLENDIEPVNKRRPWYFLTNYMLYPKRKPFGEYGLLNQNDCIPIIAPVDDLSNFCCRGIVCSLPDKIESHDSDDHLQEICKKKRIHVLCKYIFNQHFHLRKRGVNPSVSKKTSDGKITYSAKRTKSPAAAIAVYNFPEAALMLSDLSVTKACDGKQMKNSTGDRPSSNLKSFSVTKSAEWYTPLSADLEDEQNLEMDQQSNKKPGSLLQFFLSFFS